MSRRQSYVVLGLLAAALLGVVLMAIPGSPLHQKPTLGLDLQGGLEVTLQAVPPPNRELTQEDLDRSVDIMRNRVDKLGVTEPEIRTQGSDQIVIQLPGVKDPEAAARIIGTTAQLELYDLETSLVGPSVSLQGQPVEHASLYQLLAQVQSQVEDDQSDAWYVVNPKTKRVVSGPYESKEQALKKSGGKLPAGRELFAVPQDMVVVTCGQGAVVCPGANGAGVPASRTWYYLFKYDPPTVPQMTGEDLKLSGTRADFDTSPGGGGRPIVTMEFTNKGSDKFEQITRDEWIRGKLKQQPQHFAIVLDREIKTFPQIDFQDSSLSGGIGGGRAQIQGLDSLQEAKDIALVLQTGALPVKFETLASDDVSATLGKDSLNEAKRAAIGGLILVAIFLLIFYRFLGVVAVAGLGIYAAFLYAAILLFNVTLTLPGFAGLVLTFGVAADANVVIFERIKEEVRAGRSIRAAISTGYQKGFHTIVDANVVTAITALVLFAVSTASVRGFALMLLIGTVLSMLTAVAATRALLTLLSGFSWFDNPRFMGATAQEIPRWQRIDVIGRRRLWFVISLVAIGLSVVALIVQGLNLGIDFEGGTQVRFGTDKPVSLSDVRSQVAAIGQEGAVVQGRGASEGSDLYTRFQVRTESLTREEQVALTDALTQEVDAKIENVRNVSASFSRQILEGAIVAILVSFGLIALYVTSRYEWRFAVPILRTLFNDVLITLGIYAISGREVTAATVAAVLTILGFSIYDTIIVFDRVRENIKLMPRASIATIANVSVWEVLRRSMVTSFITLLPIVSLFFFGGATLQDFAFAIMVGILIGAVSTIFVATPLLVSLMERDPVWKRRIDRDPELDIAQSVGGLALAETAAEEEGDAAEPSEPEAAEVPVPAAAAPGGPVSSKRERRRQRRASRPHGRAR
ncbi:MAG TPA: protein translocase subunit SecD [Gaiellaceae bacterium]|nr:protein translocase subunit SecD [Gaiellaceae bacterium]